MPEGIDERAQVGSEQPPQINLKGCGSLFRRSARSSQAGISHRRERFKATGAGRSVWMGWSWVDELNSRLIRRVYRG